MSDAERDARLIYDIACIREQYPNATREDVDFKKAAMRNLLAVQAMLDELEQATGATP